MGNGKQDFSVIFLDENTV